MNVCDCKLTVWIAHPKGTIVIDADDADTLSTKWGVQQLPNGSVKCMSANINGKTVRLHRLLLGEPAGVVDHINGDPLDNRRSNLRVATKAENNRNRRHNRKSYAGLKGVTLHRPGLWIATIQHEGRRMGLGLFESPEAAARAYDAAAMTLHGDFAKTNAAMGLLAAQNRGQ